VETASAYASQAEGGFEPIARFLESFAVRVDAPLLGRADLHRAAVGGWSPLLPLTTSIGRTARRSPRPARPDPAELADEDDVQAR
jgi:hypothetical protein